MNIAPQKFNTFLYVNGKIEHVEISFSEDGDENTLNIGARSFVSDKEGKFIGSGLSIEGSPQRVSTVMKKIQKEGGWLTKGNNPSA